MLARKKLPKPAMGMRYTFKVGAVPSYADIPVRVVYVWPRFRSGDYLVTLEYDRPGRWATQEQFEAFLSELEPVPVRCSATGAEMPAASFSRWSDLAVQCARRIRSRPA